MAALCCHVSISLIFCACRSICHSVVTVCSSCREVEAGVNLTWCVEQARPPAVVGHLLLTVLWVVNHGLQLLHAAPIVQGHGVGLLGAGTSHMGQLCIVVLHWCPDLVFCPENNPRKMLEGRTENNHTYIPQWNWSKQKFVKAVWWVTQHITINHHLSTLFMWRVWLENFCFS